jgi:hypothetical protein
VARRHERGVRALRRRAGRDHFRVLHGSLFRYQDAHTHALPDALLELACFGPRDLDRAGRHGGGSGRGRSASRTGFPLEQIVELEVGTRAGPGLVRSPVVVSILERRRWRGGDGVTSITPVASVSGSIERDDGLRPAEMLSPPPVREPYV